ncbi:MAG: hypothetical protein QXI58_02910 [Candidatus Micrarchaeia archaeon]
MKDLKNLMSPAVILIFFIFLTIFVNFNLIRDLESQVPTLGLSFLYLNDVNHLTKKFFDVNNFSFSNEFVFYPIGREINEGWIIILFIMIINLFINDIVISYNILYIFSTLLSLIFTYKLVKYYTDDRLVSLYGSVAFSLSNFHFAHSDILPIYHFEFLPLVVYYVVYYIDSPNPKNYILFMVSYLMNALTSWYYATMATFVVMIILIVHTISQVRKNKNKINKFKTLTFLILGLGITWIALYNISPYANFNEDKLKTFSRDEYKIEYSADLTNYFLPPPSHIFFGRFTEGIYKKYTGNSAENSLYIGLSNIFLCIVAIIFLKNRNIYFISLISFIFLVLSLGPLLKIGGDVTNIPLPLNLLKDIPPLSLGRALSRYGIIAILFLLIVASFGLKRILSIKNKNFKLIILSLFLIFFVVDIHAGIPNPKKLPNVPSFYDNIKKEDNDTFTILETPFGWSCIYEYYQIKHEKYLIGGCGDRTWYDYIYNFSLKTPFLKEILLLSDNKKIQYYDLEDFNKTISNLRIKYVTVHKYNPKLLSYGVFVKDNRSEILSYFINKTNLFSLVYEDEYLRAYIYKYLR